MGPKLVWQWDGCLFYLLLPPQCWCLAHINSNEGMNEAIKDWEGQMGRCCRSEVTQQILQCRWEENSPSQGTETHPTALTTFTWDDRQTQSRQNLNNYLDTGILIRMDVFPIHWCFYFPLYSDFFSPKLNCLWFPDNNISCNIKHWLHAKRDILANEHTLQSWGNSPPPPLQ